MTPIRDAKANQYLVVETASVGEERRRGAAAQVDVEIPLGVHALEVDDLASGPQLRPAGSAAAAGARALRFEPIEQQLRPALLMFPPGGLGVRVNGLPAPSVSVLGVGDQVQLENAVLHVTRFRLVEPGPPPKQLVGRPCGVCRAPLVSDTRVIVHDCGLPMHLEPESKPAEERLECALLGSCPECLEPVSLESGFVFRPEG